MSDQPDFEQLQTQINITENEDTAFTGDVDSNSENVDDSINETGA
jgi:hypothetical protein